MAPTSHGRVDISEELQSIQTKLLLSESRNETTAKELEAIEAERDSLLRKLEDATRQEKQQARDAFEANQQANTLASRLGFSDIQDALEHVKDKADFTEQQRYIERSKKLLSRLGISGLDELEALVTEPVNLKKLLEPNHTLKEIPLALASRSVNSPLSTPTKPPRPTQQQTGPVPPQPAFAGSSPSKGSPSRTNLQSEIVALQKQYDDLKRKHYRVLAVHKKDWADWKEYKAWIFNGEEPKRGPKKHVTREMALARKYGVELADLHSPGPHIDSDDEEIGELLRARVVAPGIPGFDFDIDGADTTAKPRAEEATGFPRVKGKNKENVRGKLLVPASDDYEPPLPPEVGLSEEDMEVDQPVIGSSQTEYESLLPINEMSFFKRPRPNAIQVPPRSKSSSPPSNPSVKESERSHFDVHLPLMSPLTSLSPSPSVTPLPDENERPVIARPETAARSTPAPPLLAKTFLPTPSTTGKPLRRGAIRPPPKEPSSEVEFVDTPVIKKPAVTKYKAYSKHLAEAQEGEPSRKKRRASEFDAEEEEDTSMPLPISSTSRGKGKTTDREEQAQTAKAHGKGKSKYPEDYDYSVHKGRGRYARARGDDEDDTINSRYQIDPEQNNGVAYAYNEVVRKKADRAKLRGGECIECAGFYANVGPYPPRLQPPLFRSPSPGASSPTKGHHPHCSHHREEGDQGRVADEHRQKVSRHRAQWDAPQTPPQYWEIGFPDTQQVEEINEEAARIHKRKRERIEQDKRYKKR